MHLNKAIKKIHDGIKKDTFISLIEDKVNLCILGKKSQNILVIVATWVRPLDETNKGRSDDGRKLSLIG
jgi:hypothetical protein